MARFYNTSQTDFVDYNAGQRQQQPSGGMAADLFGDINALPQDRPRLQELITGYESEIDGIVSQLQANPRAVRQLQPQIQSIRQRLAMDKTAGELKAISDRYSQYSDVRKRYTESLKDDPFQATMALNELDASLSPIEYDPQTGSFNQIQPQAYVAPLTDADKNKWFTTYVPKITDTLLEQVKEQEGLDKYTTLLERGELKGVLKERALRILAQQVTPQMIAAENQRRRFAGDTEIDESSFFDPATGQPNLNTYLGRMVEAAAESVANTQRDTQFIQNQDEAALARMKGNEDLRVARGRARIDDRDANWWADRLGALYRGEGYDINEAGFAQSSFLTGNETEDGWVVQSVTKVAGREPIVSLIKPETRNSNGVVLAPAQERSAPLNIDLLGSLKSFPKSFVPKVDAVLRSDPNYDATSRNLSGEEPYLPMEDNDIQRRQQPQQQPQGRQTRRQQSTAAPRRVPGINY